MKPYKHNIILFLIIIFIISIMTSGYFFVDKNKIENLIPEKLTAKDPSYIKEKPQTIDFIRNATILTVGDIMLDRNVFLLTQKADDYEHPFKLIGEFLEKPDITVANLEGPVTDFKSIANGTRTRDRMTFTFSPNFLDPLKKYFDVISLANNHTHNFGEVGIKQTKDYLTEKKIKFFGGPYNKPENLSTIIEHDNIKIGFVGYHQLIGSGFEDVVEEIKSLEEKTDFTIAMPHWGYEYQETKPSNIQKEEAHAMIDAGADVILGGHPHVIQPIEEYNNKIIFYSLGNFIFDQYFSTETMQGLTVKTILKKENNIITVKYTLHPIEITKQSQAVLASEEVKINILEHLHKYSITRDEIKNQILTGVIEL
jgi:gamma-polyglutamate biosynthesis protein CapA